MVSYISKRVEAITVFRKLLMVEVLVSFLPMAFGVFLYPANSFFLQLHGVAPRSVEFPSSVEGLFFGRYIQIVLFLGRHSALNI